MQGLADVISLSARRNRLKRPVPITELLDRLQCYISRDNLEYVDVTFHLVNTLHDPNCPDMNLNRSELAELDKLIAKLDSMSWDDRLEALFTATLYMGDVGNWNPNIAQPLRNLPFSSEGKLLIELSYGILGFAWQIHTGKPIIFSQGEYYARRAELKKTP